MNFDLGQAFNPGGASDETRNFWVPVHKLFSRDGVPARTGPDRRAAARSTSTRSCAACTASCGASATTRAGRSPRSTARRSSSPTGSPSSRRDLGPGVLAALPHPLVAAAQLDGEPLALRRAPRSARRLLAQPDGPHRGASRGTRPSTCTCATPSGRTAAIEDLNDDPDVVQRVNAGGYRALHYIDFSGDGWVAASCPQLAVQVPRNIPAYSLVAAPDFYPNCDQRELVEWWMQRVPTALRDRVWQTPPLTLSDERIAPNIAASRARFRGEDDTVTAIVSLPLAGDPQQRPLEVGATLRHAHLPDGAAGIFAPGWDTSVDETTASRTSPATASARRFPRTPSCARRCRPSGPRSPRTPGAASRRSSRRRRRSPMRRSAASATCRGTASPGPASSAMTSSSTRRSNFVDYVRSALDNASPWR